MQRLLLAVVLAPALALAPTVCAQNAGTKSGMGNVGSTTTGSAGTLSGSNPNLSGTAGSQQTRSVFLAGDVQFDDGTPANNQIKIERFCGVGGSRVETHTDSKGHFSFQVGGEQGNDVSDAEYSNSTFGGGKNGLGATNLTGRAPTLLGCEVRALYPGYLSDNVDISSHRSLDDPRIGTLVLHRLADVKGTTISLTSAQAPKSAQKNYEKAQALILKGKLSEAEPHLTSALAAYPQYAEAWVALGDVQQRSNKPDEAVKSYLAAAAADSRYVTPLDSLARLYTTQKNWSEAAKYSKQTIDLNPVEFPSSFWYNAIANYSLKNSAESEKSARALIKLDSQHRYPEAQTILAEYTAKRGDLDEAADHLKTYLAQYPAAHNADLVRHELAQIEAAKATQARNEPKPQN